jgi:hypothetical protein
MQQQQSCVQQSNGQDQKITFKDGKVSDFDFDLDCEHRVVVITHKATGKSKNLAIHSDGTVNGTVEFVQDVADDGKGTSNCFLDFRVDFSGTAECPADTSTSVGKKLTMNATVNFDEPTDQQLREAGIEPGPGPSQQPGQAPTTQPSPSASPSGGPSTTPSPSPTPTSTFTVTPSTTKVCKVDNICPVEGKVDLSCGQQQGTPTSTPSP